MPLRQHNPAAVFPPYANYAHAVEVSAGSRMLFISGLNGYEQDGVTPAGIRNVTRAEATLPLLMRSSRSLSEKARVNSGLSQSGSLGFKVSIAFSALAKRGRESKRDGSWTGAFILPAL